MVQVVCAKAFTWFGRVDSGVLNDSNRALIIVFCRITGV